MTNFDQRHQKVLEQYNADTINQFFIQSERSSRITWRELRVSGYVVREDSKFYREVFFNDLFRAIAGACAGNNYRRFSFLFKPREHTTRSGGKSFVYEVVSHEIKFIDVLNRLNEEFIELLIELSGAADDKKIAAQAKFNAKIRAQFGSWKTDSSSLNLDEAGACECEYDEGISMMNVNSSKQISLNPTHYKDNVRTTSEALKFVGAAIKANGPTWIELGQVTEHWPLVKLMIAVMDRNINLGAFLINADDVEEWDYFDPEIEDELKAYRG